MSRRSIDRRAVAVTYEGLPISSGGAHSLGRMSRRDAYKRAMSFLATCTEPISPIEVLFYVNDVPELPRQRYLDEELERRFGKREGVLWQKGPRLELDESRVGEALDFLDNVDPQPTNGWGMAPIWLWIIARFRILDPTTGRPLPGQDPERFPNIDPRWNQPLGTSMLKLILDNGARLGLDLCIPGEVDDHLREVVLWLQEHLPMRLSPSHWRLWAPTRTGSLTFRRTPSPLTGARQWPGRS
jgi:hypothetical protein